MKPEIRDLCARALKLDAEATKGPYTVRQFCTDDFVEYLVVFPDGEDVSLIHKFADAELLAEYRTAAPALAAALLASESAREELEREMRALFDSFVLLRSSLGGSFVNYAERLIEGVDVRIAEARAFLAPTKPDEPEQEPR